MNGFKKLFISVIISSIGLYSAEIPESRERIFSEWYEKCSGFVDGINYYDPQVMFLELQCAIKEIIALNTDFLRSKMIVDGTAQRFISPGSFFSQKLIVPPESKIYFWGDLHGDIAVLLDMLKNLVEDEVLDDNFEIIQPNTYFIFLGDFVDRGKCGIEVLYTLARLKIKNPEKLFLIRGNHESIDQNETSGFKDELEIRYMREDNEEHNQGINDAIGMFMQTILHNFYSTLPAVIYLGIGEGTKKFIQCCHGGMEIGYNPRLLFTAPCAENESVVHTIQHVERKKLFKDLCFHSGIQSFSFLQCLDSLNISRAAEVSEVFNQERQVAGNVSLGFMWSDFSALAPQTQTRFAGRGPGILSYGSVLTENIIASYAPYEIIAVMRGHQHNYTMPELIGSESKGFFVLPWHIPVYTTIATTVIHIGHSRAGAVVFNNNAAYLKLNTEGSLSDWGLLTMSLNKEKGIWTEWYDRFFREEDIPFRSDCS